MTTRVDLSFSIMCTVPVIWPSLAFLSAALAGPIVRHTRMPKHSTKLVKIQRFIVPPFRFLNREPKNDAVLLQSHTAGLLAPWKVVEHCAFTLRGGLFVEKVHNLACTSDQGLDFGLGQAA